MGLFDIFKGSSKEKEPKICYRCGKEITGILGGMKLSDNVRVCFDCYPMDTKLMGAKDVEHKFKGHLGSSKEIDRLIEYRVADKKRAEKFQASEGYLDDKILVDREHMMFKLKDYEEIFMIQQIESLIVVAAEEDFKFRTEVRITLNNWLYKTIPVSYVFRATKLTRKNRLKEFESFVMRFHQDLCPNASLITNV